jgi:hypothetical protein
VSLSKFEKDFGKGMPTKTIISCILLAIVSFFYIIHVGSFFQPTVFPLIDRVTYSTQYHDKYFFNKYYDSLLITAGTALWLIFTLKGELRFVLSVTYSFFAFMTYIINEFSLIEFSVLSSGIIIVMIFLYGRIGSLPLLFNTRLFINYLSATGFVIAGISTPAVIIPLFFPDIPLPPINFHYYLILLGAALTPFLLIFMGFSLPLKLIMDKLSNNRHHIMIDENRSQTNKKIISYLCVIILFSTFVSLIPFIDKNNLKDEMIGSDSKDYLRFLNSLGNSKSIDDFLYQAFVVLMAGDRPLSLVTFFIFAQLFGQDNLIDSIEYLPLVLGPLLIVCIFFLTRELTSNITVSLISCFLTVTAFHLLVGMYGGFYANWFSLIFGYIAILFLYNALNFQKKL